MERASQHRRTDHDNKHKNSENKVRRALMRHGFILQRDRTRNRTLMRHGHYRVVSLATGNVAFKEFYDWTIDDIEAMVNLLSSACEVEGGIPTHDPACPVKPPRRLTLESLHNVVVLKHK